MKFIRLFWEAFASAAGFILGLATMLPAFYFLALWLGALPPCLR